MVTIKSFKSNLSKDGKQFVSLELTGGLELVQSNNTGRFYATVRRCFIPATFDEEVAESLVGTQIQGEIVRVLCDPYQYTVKDSGEVITLQHSLVINQHL
jgi:hypothetical protein